MAGRLPLDILSGAREPSLRHPFCASWSGAMRGMGWLPCALAEGWGQQGSSNGWLNFILRLKGKPYHKERREKPRKASLSLELVSTSSISGSARKRRSLFLPPEESPRLHRSRSAFPG